MNSTPHSAKPFTYDFLEQLEGAARTAVDDSLKVRPNERVLIVSNPPKEVYEIAQALYNAVETAGGTPLLLVQPVKSQLDYADDAVLRAIGSQPDVFISISSQKLGKDRFAIAEPIREEGKTYDHIFHYLMAVKKLRAFWSPSINRDMFTRTLDIDYSELSRRAGAVKKVLDNAESVRITAPGGTDIEIGISEREAFVDDGDLSEVGRGGNLPAGEAFISPSIEQSDGVIVFDGSISLHDGDLIAENPVKVSVRGGYVEAVEGSREASLLLETITMGEENAITFEREGKLPGGKGDLYKRNARHLGELGIGLNPHATVSGNMLEDEKAYRTCHFAIGSNYDEDAPALIHLDCLVRDPTITCVYSSGEEVRILRDGEYAL
jgi:leucyl aminopeptidase (aminopeptidase T)